MRVLTKEEYALEFDTNMKIYITEKIRLGKPINIDEKYRIQYAAFIEATKKKYSK
jgi:hypothetical protein